MIEYLDQDFRALNYYVQQLQPSKIFILVDENTHEYCLPWLLTNLETDIAFEIIEIEAGEDNKTIETATQLWEILAEFEADRKSLLINLGGGVITDLGGFVASTYKRGIKFINIPTSLLAMCDASIGGKTGIDHQYLKNIVGTFAVAERIFLFPEFLKTLPFRELRSGFAEMLKHGLIADEQHWEDLTSIVDLNAETIAPYIQRSMEIKQEVVSADFREENIRKTLNFGHTIGHAIESLCLKNNISITHEEAVAAGMICESFIAQTVGLISCEICTTIVDNINSFFPPLPLATFTNDDLIYLMFNDKKNNSGQINFSLIDRIGHCMYDQKCHIDDINAALNAYKNAK